MPTWPRHASSAALRAFSDSIKDSTVCSCDFKLVASVSSALILPWELSNSEAPVADDRLPAFFCLPGGEPIASWLMSGDCMETGRLIKDEEVGVVKDDLNSLRPLMALRPFS